VIVVPRAITEPAAPGDAGIGTAGASAARQIVETSAAATPDTRIRSSFMEVLPGGKRVAEREGVTAETV
jgi:hypothetical protein